MERAGTEWVQVPPVLLTRCRGADVLLNLSELQLPYLQSRTNTAYISGRLCGSKEPNIFKVLGSSCSLKVSHIQSYLQSQ